MTDKNKNVKIRTEIIKKEGRFMKKVFLILLSLLFIFSCSGKAKSNNKNGSGNSNKNAGVTVKDPKMNEIDKYNIYVDSYNSLLNFDSTIDSYLKNAGSEEKLNTSKEISGYFNYKPSFLDKLKKATTSEPKMKDLDGAGAKLAPALEELTGLLNEADEYYKAKDYLDDKYAKGQELHTKILAAIKNYDTAMAEYNAALRKKANEVKTMEMEKAKKDGRMITYNKMLTLQLTEDIMYEIQSQKLTAANFTTADLTKIKPLYEQFNEVQKQLRDSIKDPELMKKEGYDESKPGSSFDISKAKDFVDTSTKFKTSILFFIDRVEKKQVIDAFRLKHNFPMENEDGSPEQLNKLRDELIQKYNQTTR